MADDVIEEIKELKLKKEKAVTAVTKFSTQREGLIEDRDALTKELKDRYDIAPDEVEAKVDDLTAERDKLLEAAREKLSKIKL